MTVSLDVGTDGAPPHPMPRRLAYLVGTTSSKVVPAFTMRPVLANSRPGSASPVRAVCSAGYAGAVGRATTPRTICMEAVGG